MTDDDDITIGGNTIQGGDYSTNLQQNIGVNYGAIYFGGRAVESAPAPENRIFLSYGRDDDDPDHRDADKSFMRRLYRDLSAEGYQVWWDRETMPSRALTFLQEIRDAITPCRRLILVVGESAMKSAHVSAEWQYALSQCIPVIPILRSGDYDLLPTALRLIHTPDFRDNAQYAPALTELKRILGEPDAKLATLYGVPPLPDAYIERDAFQPVRELVLSDSEKAVVVTSQKQ